MKNVNFLNSKKLLLRAEKVIPVGTQTFSKSKLQYPVGYSPLFLEYGKGSHVWDVDGNEYIDLVSGLLPVVLGYCDPDVDEAISKQLDNGIVFSLPNPIEIELAEKLVEIIPCAEMVRFGKNGTDATSAAIRLARAYTKRDHVIAIGYHGWQDWYIGSTTRNKGVPNSVSKLTHKLPYNDINSIENIVLKHKDNVAAIILEPMNVENPLPGYLEFIREITKKYGIVMIFDEVVTGFRYSLGGAQQLFGVTPDLSAFGKAMGNGMPISAIVGRADIMREMEDIFYSGTFGGETLSIAAAISVINKMQNEPVIDTLWRTGEKLLRGIRQRIKIHKLTEVITITGNPTWLILGFNNHSKASSAAIKTLYTIEMLRNGVLTQGGHNISYSHSENDVLSILRSYDLVFSKISEELSTGMLIKNLPVPAIEPIFQVRN